uniref:PB1-like domain-containing protein n=1 Tax=Chenopodium quinoa TaxID=63459 RepID=A0A803MN27_CHEQI
MRNKTLFENVSLRYWHGGSFKIVGNGELMYMGGKGRTFQVSPDELCYWELLELGTKCRDYINITALYYLVPRKSLADGLRKIAGDVEVLEMGEIVMKHRSIDVYVLHSVEEPQLTAENPTPSVSSEDIPPPKPTKPKKLTPKKASPLVRGTRGGRGRGRGGVGVLFSADGTPVLQAPFTRSRVRHQEQHISTQSSQTSTVHQQHP